MAQTQNVEPGFSPGSASNCLSCDFRHVPSLSGPQLLPLQNEKYSSIQTPQTSFRKRNPFFGIFTIKQMKDGD